MTAVFVLLIPTAYVILQWMALSRMRDGWQVAAILPAGFMTVALLLMIVGLVTQLDVAIAAVIIGLPLATLYLVVLWPLHFAFHR